MSATATAMHADLELLAPFFEELGLLAELCDPTIEDLMIQEGRVFVMREGRKQAVAHAPISERKLRAILDTIAGELHDSIGPQKQHMYAQLPDGSRLTAIIPPASPFGVAISIRKFGRFRTLEDLRDGGMMSEEVYQLLLGLARGRRNTILSGAMGSGKTTLTMALLAKLPPNARLITLEDPVELRIHHPNALRLQAVTAIGEQQAVTLGDLLTWSLRMNGDYLVFGEVRGEEAGHMLRGMRTGHPGISTIHATSARRALQQVAFLASAHYGGNVSLARQETALSAENVVQVGWDENGQRRVLEVLEVLDYSVRRDRFRVKTLYPPQKISEKERTVLPISVIEER